MQQGEGPAAWGARLRGGGKGSPEPRGAGRGEWVRWGPLSQALGFMHARCTVCPETVPEASGRGRGWGTWGTQWMRELLPSLQSETCRNHGAWRIQGFRMGTEGWSPLQSGELSL